MSYYVYCKKCVENLGEIKSIAELDEFYKKQHKKHKKKCPYPNDPDFGPHYIEP